MGMWKFIVLFLTLVSIAVAQQPPAFRPFVATQVVVVNQPGFGHVESLNQVGANYRIERFTFFSIARIRLGGDDRRSINWMSGGAFRFYKGFNAGAALVNLNAWQPAGHIQGNFLSVNAGYVAKKWQSLVFHNFGSAARGGKDNWDFQNEYKLTKRLSILGDVQMYQYKYPNPKKSPRAWDAEGDIGLKWYFR